MTTPAGQISLSDVNTELGYTSTANISMDGTVVRALAGVPSGAIGMFNLRSKSKFTFNPVISANTTIYNIRSAAIAAGWDQILPVNITVTVNGGVTLSSNNTGTAALTTGSFPTGSTITVVNNGSIRGMGGAGGTGGGSNSSGPGGTGWGGGTAVALNYPLTITNNGTVYGGGGGGSGGGGAYYTQYNEYSPPSAVWIAGGGAGGGASGSTNSAGGPTGTGTYQGTPVAGFGSASGAGAGTIGGSASFPISELPPAYITGGIGGNGGTWGASGATGATATNPEGINPPNAVYAGGSAGAGGYAAQRNGQTLTWGGTNGSSTTYVKGSII